MKQSNQRVMPLLLVFLFLCSACAPAAPKIEVRPGYQILVDCMGREVETPNAPRRVAALDSFAGEVMVMIGAGEQMVAAPNGVKSDALLVQMYPALREVASPMSGGTINGETLAALQPDLVLLKRAMYEAEGEREKLDKLNIPYLVIGYDSMEEQIEALELIGTALGGKGAEQAGGIATYYRSVISRVTELQKQITEPVRVYHSISEAVRTDGEYTLGNDWITCVGAVNVSAGETLKAAESDYFAAMEQIYTWDPDVIICNEADTAAYFREDPKWTGLGAVQRGAVYSIPVGATRWGHRGSMETFFAMLWLGKTLYPEVYRSVDLKEEVFGFYQTYLGITLTEEQYACILAGNGIRLKSSGGNG
jgi:iron complex transport system substrate-binding protein